MVCHENLELHVFRVIGTEGLGGLHVQLQVVYCSDIHCDFHVRGKLSSVLLGGDAYRYDAGSPALYLQYLELHYDQCLTLGGNGDLPVYVDPSNLDGSDYRRV